MGWLSKEKKEPEIVSKEGIVARIGSYSPGDYSVWLVLLEGEPDWMRLETSSAAVQQIDEPLALTQVGDAVEFTFREARPGYGVCLHFVNFSLEAQLRQARADCAERNAGAEKNKKDMGPQQTQPLKNAKAKAFR